MRTVRRYLVLAALMFWLGGFTFYASIVVPIGTEELGSASEQARITRKVTVQLNEAAVLCLLPLLWDAAIRADPASLRRWSRLGLWLLMVLCQVGLFLLHHRLEGLMRLDETSDLDDDVFRAAFRPLHRLYLWTHTFQWGAGLIYMALMLKAWQSEDARPPHPVAKKAIL